VIVVDSSVAIAALTGHRPAREAVVEQRLVAPHLIDVEVANALRGLALGGKIAPTDAGRALKLWQGLAIDRVPIAPLLPRIWELRENLTAHDATFVATAEAQGVALVTADRRLAATVGPRCPVQLIPL